MRVWAAGPPSIPGCPGMAQSPRGIVPLEQRELESDGEGEEDFLLPTSSGVPLGRSPLAPSPARRDSASGRPKRPSFSAKFAATQKFPRAELPHFGCILQPPYEGREGKALPSPCAGKCQGSNIQRGCGGRKNPFLAASKPSNRALKNIKCFPPSPDYLFIYLFISLRWGYFGLRFNREGMSEMKLLGTRSRHESPTAATGSSSAAQTRREHPLLAVF